MSHVPISFQTGCRWVVGSCGSGSALTGTTAAEALAQCALVEVRLDVLAAAGGVPERSQWRHLAGVPLLFTARCKAEGGAVELADAERAAMLLAVLEDAALLDVEVASLVAMAGVIAAAGARGLPWIGSFHDFEKLPATAVLEAAARQARAAGAAAFKVAARLHTPADVARLAEFQSSNQGLPLATMGMGPLAPVSRLLCAQYGSVLNYGYLGETPTAPGQWDAGLLKLAIARLALP
jgi:3-dehydroquinate dehydratase-1